MGRWSYLTLAGKKHKQFTFISAYQVCKQPLKQWHTIATKTATAQQIRMLCNQNNPHTPRQAFIANLSAFISTLQTAQHEIFLAGDFNESLNNPSSHMSILRHRHGLTDLMHHLTGQDHFNTYTRGTNSIDYILCTDHVATAASAGCYEPFQYRVKGDHRSMIVDFNIHLLFSNTTHHLATIPQREFQSKDIAHGKRYIELKSHYLQNKNFAAHLDQLDQHLDPTLAERLNRDFQRASIAAANWCTRRPQTAYSMCLASLSQEKNVLHCLISQLLTRHSYSDSIAYLTQNGHQFTLPTTIQDCIKCC